MKYLVVIILAVVAFVLIKIKSKHRIYITEAFLLVIIVLNLAYNNLTISSIMSFIRPVNQLTYQPEYQDSKEFPDALMPVLLKDKTVYVKEDYYDAYGVWLLQYSWIYAYAHYYATVNYINGIDADVKADESFNDSIITKDMLSDFTDLGYANDMYRNTNMYSGYEFESLNYFGHYWYYNTMIAPMHIYINPDGLYEAKELVWLWQPMTMTHEPDDKEKSAERYEETEYMFLMSKEYYDNKIKQ